MEEWPSLNTSKKCWKRLGKTSSMWTASCRVLWRRRHCLNLQTGYWTSSGSIAMSWKCKWGWIKPTSLLILILSSLRRRCEPRGRCWRWALPEFQLQIWVKRWRMWKIRRRWGSWTWWGWGKRQGKLLLSRSKSTWRPAAVKVCWSNKELFENHFYSRRSNGSVCSGLCKLLQVHQGWARDCVSMGEEVKKFFLAKVAQLPEEEFVLHEHDLFWHGWDGEPVPSEAAGLLGRFEKADIWITGRGPVRRGDFPTLWNFDLTNSTEGSHLVPLLKCRLFVIAGNCRVKIKI